MALNQQVTVADEADQQFAIEIVLRNLKKNCFTVLYHTIFLFFNCFFAT